MVFPTSLHTPSLVASQLQQILIIVLCFYYCNGDIWLYIKDIIRPLSFASGMELSLYNNFSVCKGVEGHLFSKMIVLFPAGFDNGWIDDFRTYVPF